jgi:hypothetical protein
VAHDPEPLLLVGDVAAHLEAPDAGRELPAHDHLVEAGGEGAALDHGDPAAHLERRAA